MHLESIVGRALALAYAFASALVVLASLGTAVSADPALSSEVAAGVCEPLGHDRFDVVEITLPDSVLPEVSTLAVERDGALRRLVLQRRSVRAAGFRLLVQGAGGSFADLSPPPPGPSICGPDPTADELECVQQPGCE
jgi:hypothetical protein